MLKKPKSGGGWRAILYALRKSRQMGGLLRAWQALRSRNACKTCALGMGGQRGGMVNELGRFPEVCKKSLQAMAADMQPAIPADFWNTWSLPELRALSPRALEACGRLVHPVLYEADARHYQIVSWDEALDRIARLLAATAPDETFWYFSGRSSNEAGFLLQLLARLYGTNHVNNCSFYCHQASGVGLQSSLGTGTATLQLDDLEQADLVVLLGGNPASNHPRLMTTLMHIRRRGGQVIVVNPVVETGLVRFRVPSDPWSLLFGTRIATQYIQPHIGGDLALLTGLAKRIFELGAHDERFLRHHCTGYEAWRDHLAGLPWDEIVAASGVAWEAIDAAARSYAACRNAVFAWTMGITHHAHGVANVQAIANLALQRGMVGRPGAGLLPIRGHSNVQGIGSVGVTPRLKEAIFAALERELKVRLPATPGMDTLACLEAAHAGQLKAGVCLGGNLYGATPDATFAAAALGRLELLVYLSTTLNTGHVHGLARQTLILPVLARDEEPQPTTQESMFNYIRLSDGGPPRHAGPRSEVQVIAELGRRLAASTGPDHPLRVLDWQQLQHTGNIRATIARVVPGFEKLAEIDRTRQEFYVAGRILHEPRFPTADGRAVLHCHRLPPPAQAAGALRLMTVRSEGQFNTVVYEEEDLYRGQERRDVILIHPDDLARLGLAHDQLVTVRSAAGTMAPLRVRAFPDIRPGNALMYYPEANVLVPRVADPLSRTPAFKNVLVTLEPILPASARPPAAAQPAVS
jgi:molybdopterin-dependent oxidoreductase alpha subunit